MAALTAHEKQLLEDVLSIAGDNPAQIETAVRRVIGQNLRGPDNQASRGYFSRLLTRSAKKKIQAARLSAQRAALRQTASH